MVQFNREYRFAAGISGRPGFEVGATSQSQPTALHINFSVEKADVESPNTSKIKLWNLSPSQLATLSLKDCIASLKAGYGNDMPLISMGNITSVVTEPDNADMMTSIEIVDGRIALRDTYITLSYAGKINAKKIIEDAASKMGVALVVSNGAVFADFPNGFSFIGAARNALKKVCDTSGLVWSIQNGVLQVKRPNETISNRVYVISADAGLIGIPKRIIKGAKSADYDYENQTEEKAQMGWEVKYFMNGAIGVNDYVKLDSKYAQGYFRVYKLIIDGDNIEGEWTCTAELLEVS